MYYKKERKNSHFNPKKSVTFLSVFFSENILSCSPCPFAATVLSDKTFPIYRAAKSVDKRILCSLEKSKEAFSFFKALKLLNVQSGSYGYQKNMFTDDQCVR